MSNEQQDPINLGERSEFMQIFPNYKNSLEKLDHYVEILKFWQKTTNLIAPNSLAHIWSRHIIDSAQIAQISPNALKWVDIGSGGGFPGLVIAIIQGHVKGFQMHLIESDQKKCAFLREVSRETYAPVQVHNARIENIAKDIAPNSDVVSARALAPLNNLLNLSAPFLEAGATGIFLKGKLAIEELTKSTADDSLSFEKRESLTDSQASIIVVRKHMVNI